MTQTAFSSLLSDLWDDLSDPSLVVQLATVFGCIVLGWVLARALRAAFSAKDVQLRVVRLGVESFSWVLSPTLALLLIAIAKPILARWHHINVLRVAMPLLASFALIRLAFYVLRRIFVRSGRAGNFILLFERVFAAMVWAAVALYITGLWPDLIQFMDETVIPIGRFKASLLTILQGAASVAVTLVLALWGGALLEERLMRLDTMHSSLRMVMARMGRAVLVLIAILVSLALVGIDLTVLSVFGGALGVGLGLGLQKIVSSYVSGFVILLERSLAVGDMVAVDKYYGQVTQINTRYTVLRSLDGVESVVPNEMLVSSPVQNYSLTNRELRLAVQVTVGYDTDVDLALQLLAQAAAGVARVCASPAPQAVLLRFGADGLELELGFWIIDPENGRQGVSSDVNRAILRALQAHQIKIPYPQREVRQVTD